MSDLVCPKCGGDRTYYYCEDGKLGCSWYFPSAYHPTHAGGDGERFHVTCKVCSYQSLEPVRLLVVESNAGMSAEEAIRRASSGEVIEWRGMTISCPLPEKRYFGGLPCEACGYGAFDEDGVCTSCGKRQPSESVQS